MTRAAENCALPLPFLVLASLSPLLMFLLPPNLCVFLIPAAEIGMAGFVLQSCAKQHFSGVSARDISLRMIAFCSACKAAILLLPVGHGLMILGTSLAGYIQIFIMLGFANRPLNAAGVDWHGCLKSAAKKIL